MLLIFGTRIRQIKAKNEGGRLNCSHCKSNGTVAILARFKYFHILWIPIFAYGLKRITCCTHCKQFRYTSEIPQGELMRINKIEFKIPLKYYSGSGFFMLIFANLIFTIFILN